jgi:Mn2+/Fe2+ NRAMP family transporter
VDDRRTSRGRRLLTVIGPGILVAATGVGAGDLATGAFTGSQLGTAVLWAVVVGALMKYVLNEGLGRWQLATGETLIEGSIRRLGRGIGWAFLPYLVLWSFFVGSALMSACGVALHALIPVFEDAARAKVVFGVGASLLGLVLVFLGGFRLFEKVMGVCIAIMFVTAIVTAAMLWPGMGAFARGLLVPTIPDVDGAGLTWTIALIGGIGGTVTVLCYGYWIREAGRAGRKDMTTCRIDLGVGYAMTAVFGIAMVIIGSSVEITGKGAGLLVTLSDRLGESVGSVGRWAFLLGALGAVFSSLLGVWQAVPYIFADVWRLSFRGADDAIAPGAAVDTRGIAYRGYLVAIAVIPMAGLLVSFREIQKLYAVIGAAFMPLLAVLLLILNGRADWVGVDMRNRWPALTGLVVTLGFFGWVAWTKWAG